MFTKIHKTNFPPSQPTIVWDGECKFCRWWKSRWQLETGKNIRYLTYQKVAGEFPDIPPKEFKKASRLIESDGRIYSGPDSGLPEFIHFRKQKMALLVSSNKMVSIFK
jgi:predicted DCC family thiol-disulfide oxidoreductase YuxK